MWRKTGAAEDAVAPVVAVVLLVAITIVLAAVVFVLAAKVSDRDASNSPPMAFQRDETADRVTLVRGAPDKDWGQYQIRADRLVPGLVFDRNDAAGLGDTALTPAAIDLPGGAVTAGDYYEFCATAPATNVKVIFIDKQKDQVVATWVFKEIAAC
jgi:hypothetical protein